MEIQKEKYDPEAVDLSTFGMQEELDPRLWGSNNEFNPDIRMKLLKIAQDFIVELGIDTATIDDIILTGSMANYNWSKYSDIDLHIILDFSQVDENVELVRDFFNARKTIWNNSHDIKMFNYEVEIYMQDSAESHVSTGVFSLKSNQWTIRPTQEDSVNIDEDNVKRKAASFMDQIDRLEELFHLSKFDDVFNMSSTIRQKVKRMRRSGLEAGGQYSVENLAFKVLRREGYIGTLLNLRIDSYDQMNSITDVSSNIHQNEIEEIALPNNKLRLRIKPAGT